MDNLQKAKDLVYLYCEQFGITPHDLFKTHGKSSKPAKVYKGVHIDTMRMALGYYITNNFPLYSQEVAKLTGYRDRSSLSSNAKKIVMYIKNDDAFFRPYWEKMLEIGELFKPNVKFFKTDNGYIREAV